MFNKVFTDCGAPSLYNKFARKHKKGGMGSTIEDRKWDDFSFFESDDFYSYRDSYIEFLNTNKQFIDVYSNLDVINNGEKTYENQKMLEEQGLKPLPVFHFGSDLKFLERYIDEGYEYIAMGGVQPNPINLILPALDAVWNKYLRNPDGTYKIKVHGFGITHSKLMRRYPWYSVDSSSWKKLAIYGKCVFLINGQQCVINFLDEASDARRTQRENYYNLSPKIKEIIDEKIKDFPLGESELIPVDKVDKRPIGCTGPFTKDGVSYYAKIIKKGLINDYGVRTLANRLFYEDLKKEKGGDFHIYYAGGFFEDTVMEFISEEYPRLLSFFDTKSLVNVKRTIRKWRKMK